MEISGIRSAFSYVFPGMDKENAPKLDSGDKIDLHSQQILTDEEAENVYNETIGFISQDPASALSVHAGLSESRVFALLGA